MYSIVYIIVLVIKFKSKEKIRSPSIKLNKHFRLLNYVARLSLEGVVSLREMSLDCYWRGGLTEGKEAHFSLRNHRIQTLISLKVVKYLV